MKCTKCRGPAQVEVRRSNAGFCREHYLEFVQNQVVRAIEQYQMFRPDDRILVAVSGGKDSLVLWDLLTRMGYPADGLYMDLGIGDYSAESREKTVAFAQERGLKLIIHAVAEEYGATIPELAVLTRRVPCSACGLTKRHTFNRVAREHGYTVVATGHNLDDEAAVLLGNVMHWEAGYMARQSPAMPDEDGFVRKVKPLFRLTEREIAAYAVLRGIDYMFEECPNARGARSLVYKDLLNRLELESPGSKHQFFLGFLAVRDQLFPAGRDGATIQPCERCGEPTATDVCAFCRMMAKAGLTGARAGAGDGQTHDG